MFFKKKSLIKIYFSLIILIPNFLYPLDINQIVIWGHKLHSHTHSYIHYAFHKAFMHLGYKVVWLDDQDNVTQIDFSKSLFITEGQVDNNIPLKNDCYYIIHNCRSIEKYQALFNSRLVIHLYQYHKLYDSYPIHIDQTTRFDFDSGSIAIAWASDLLPHEIELNKSIIDLQHKTPSIYWIGSVGDGWAGNLTELQPFITACKENKINFIPKINLSFEKNADLIRKSYMAPAIVGDWQKNNDYVPCRVFKNISYGQMVLTNSRKANELFDYKLIYNTNTYQLFYDAQQQLADPLLHVRISELMDIVKAKHTYINRIETLLYFFNCYINK